MLPFNDTNTLAITPPKCAKPWGGDGNDTLRGGWNDDRCIQGETNINCEIVR